jgi:hypothetical protein
MDPWLSNRYAGTGPEGSGRRRVGGAVPARREQRPLTRREQRQAAELLASVARPVRRRRARRAVGWVVFVGLAGLAGVWMLVGLPG